ncbi:hypothetical protein TUM12370_07620 [Salmonella enterica subsp. enterica serovar Choleraesuis]|nr:hypothetical protein TUM12370_07620 [Salmonella enterica subsp. enterica serovar Choleraesuis]
MTDISDSLKTKKLTEISAFVQPIVNIGTGLPIGLEVLLRGNGKDGETYVPAKTFLKNLTSLDDYNVVTMRMLDLVTGEANQVSLGSALTGISFVSFNLIAGQLSCPELVKQLINFHKKLPHGINLVIELLEGYEADLKKEIVEVIKYLSSHGVKFAIDDFGNNSIDLEYLNSLNLNILKMDICMAGVHHGRLIFEKTIESLVSLADKMNVLLIAEGVETKEQLALLTECGVENIQGFYYSKPYLWNGLLS